MFKKIILGVLLLTVIGAIGSALAYNIATRDTDAAAAGLDTAAEATPAVLAQNGEQGVQAQVSEAGTATEGEPWKETGTITKLDDFGMDITLQNGETVYVELGPPEFWQNQGVELSVGIPVIVDGSNNEGMIHAYQVMLADGQTLQIRTVTGQPLWSGGVANGNGNGNSAGAQDGEHVPQPQAQVDEWITLEGTLMSFLGGNMTMATTDGQIVSFQTGQPRFFADQGVTFNVGDEITVVGYYEGEQFTAGDITQVSTGLRVMLRDPNGRPLWAGPGSGNGNSGEGGNGNGAGGNAGENGNGNGAGGNGGGTDTGNPGGRGARGGNK